MYLFDYAQYNDESFKTNDEKTNDEKTMVGFSLGILFKLKLKVLNILFLLENI
jgi:hypothetical protein